MSCKRIVACHDKFSQWKIDSYLVTKAENIKYLSLADIKDSYLLISKSGNILFTDFRYIEAASKSLSGTPIKVKKIKTDIFSSIAVYLKSNRLKRLGIESKHISFYFYSKLSEKINNYAKIMPCEDIVGLLRMVKDEAEIGCIRQAVNSSVKLVNQIREDIKIGKSEIDCLAGLDNLVKSQKLKFSFDPIIAFGRSTSEPHHIISERVIKNNNPMLIDMGVDFNSYKSDLTRVWFLGKISPVFRKIYSIVLTAQYKALELIKPGIKASLVDKVARDYIRKKGFGRFFGHSIGHGIGLEIHELPRINSKSDIVLEEGMVFSVEPGIYLPGKFGIRIEDTVLVTKKGCDCLSGSLDK